MVVAGGIAEVVVVCVVMGDEVIDGVGDGGAVVVVIALDVVVVVDVEVADVDAEDVVVEVEDVVVLGAPDECSSGCGIDVGSYQ